MIEGLRNVGRVVPLGALIGLASVVSALAGTGQPSPWQLGLQQPATEIAANINWFHDFVTVIIVLITIFVMVLMAIVMVRFSEKANPKPSKLTHHTGLEVAWTVIPIIILVVIAIPSFKLLYRQYDYPKPDLTIKAIGHQWYWAHEYPDHGGLRFDSVMVRDEDLVKREIGDEAFKQRFGAMSDFERQKALYAAAQPLWAKNKMVRLLSTDNDVVVPVGKVVHVVVTAADVIHNWTVPSFGSKVDAVPGRTTATWFRPDKEGIFYGQCSELCGKDHAFMPISVRVVKPPVFDAWMVAMKARDRRKAREILEKAAAELEGEKVASR